MCGFFFFNDTATTEIYTLSLHDALPICSASLPVGAVVTDECLMPKAEFLRTAYYDECLRPQGFHSLLTLRAARGERGAVANVCVLRSAREGEFGAEQVELLSRLAPHLRRAVAVH